MSNDQTTQRLALLFTPASANAHWVTLDQTGQPPRVIDEIGTPRFELVSLDDAPLAIYRADTAAVYDRLALAALAELVRIVNGEPNVSVDVDEQLRQLRDQLRATVDNAEEMIGSRDSRIDALQHRVECVIGEARRWKQRAEQRKIYIEHYQEEERKLRAEISSLNRGLDVARNAVDRAVNRSNHSNELVDRARAESAALRDQLGNALADYSDIQGQMNTLQAEALQTIIRISGSLPEPVIDADVVVPDFEIDSWFAEDDTPVVEISTSRLSGRMRVNLNEGVIWDGDPESDERPGAWAEPLPHDGTQRSESETISRQLDTIRDQAEKIEEAARNLSQATAERAEAWRDLDKLREERDAIHNDRANVLADNERLRKILSEKSATVGTLTDRLETAMNETRAAVRARDEADAMRRKLDARLGEERDAYIASSTAIHSVIRSYDGLAQYGANLARAVTAERPDLSEAGSLGLAYLREMATRFGA